MRLLKKRAEKGHARGEITVRAADSRRSFAALIFSRRESRHSYPELPMPANKQVRFADDSGGPVRGRFCRALQASTDTRLRRYAPGATPISLLNAALKAASEP